MSVPAVGDRAESHVVVAGHRQAGACNPRDSSRQQWFPAARKQTAERIADELHAGTRRMRCPYCQRLVRASLVEVRPFEYEEKE